MTPQRHQPIGIFDSGIGGLTVAHAIAELLPYEQMIYFGDTAHLPYGDKSEAAIQAYSVKIADVLLAKGCKVIVIACNSASSAAYLLLKEYVGRRARVVNVIDPMVALVGHSFAGKSVGLIGTKRTVQSGIYEQKIQELALGIEVQSLAAPLLVPMIEEGFINNRISEEIIANYLGDPLLEGIEALILGCTHYPLIRRQIENYYGGRVAVLDSSLVVAERLKQALEESHLMAVPGASEPNHHFMVSDFTESFEASTRHFFTRPVHLEHYTLWE
jgi:glutamate racemase